MPAALLRSADARALAAISCCVGRSAFADRMIAEMARHLAKVHVLLLGALMVRGYVSQGREDRETALRVAVVLPLTMVAVGIVGWLSGRQRPFANDRAVTALVEHAPGRSFPSRHAACAAAMTTVALRGTPGIGRLMALAGALLAASRVYAGLHYPTDVVGGWALGTALGMLVRQREMASALAR